MSAEAALAQEGKTKPRPLRAAFSPAKLQERQFAAKDYNFTAPSGCEPDEMLRPSIWSNNARKFRTGTYIHVVEDGNKWHGILRVTSCGDLWANVAWLSWALIPEMGTDPTPEEHRYKIEHIASGWRVIMRDNGKVAKDELAQRSDAEKFIESITTKKLR